MSWAGSGEQKGQGSGMGGNVGEGDGRRQGPGVCGLMVAQLSGWSAPAFGTASAGLARMAVFRAWRVDWRERACPGCVLIGNWIVAQGLPAVAVRSEWRNLFSRLYLRDRSIDERAP